MDATTTSDKPPLPLTELPFVLAAAEELAAAAAAVDGFSPLSDQARLELRQGKRLGQLWTVSSDGCDGSDGDADHAVCLTVVGGGEIAVIVSPTHRRQGIGGAALARVLERWRAESAARPGEEAATLRAWIHGDEPAAEKLLVRNGFVAVRELLLQRITEADVASTGLAERARELLSPSQVALPADAGLPELFAACAGEYRLRTFNAGSGHDANAWVRCNAAAFANHPEQGRLDREDFALLTREPWWNPLDLTVLEDPGSGEFAGYCWVKAVDDDCELYALGVRPEYSGRGLGKLLFAVSLARMAERGARTASLYVDGDNPARLLYERAGFSTARRSVQWSLTATTPMSQVGGRMEA